MDFTDITLKIPKSTDLYFNNIVTLESTSNFNQELLKTINEYDLEISKNKALLNTIGIESPNKYQDINIYLQTYGGSIYDGFATHDIISEQVNKHLFDINIKCSGHIMSMGIILLLSVPYENRFAFKNTSFMIHQAHTSKFGKLQELEEDVEETRRLNDMLTDIILKNTDITKEQLEKVYKEKLDWFINTEEALNLKLISKII
ncbi:MAG: ATP-dependent Clp protease proteolytic subunit [Erysipelotrichales bacterium]|nr:ATP-dependent Clp protease proteolytic subunit [Erysipelotrichales bacterium]